MRFMLDTNICVYISKQRPPQVLARFEEVDEGEAVMSLITYGELRSGAVKSSNPVEALRRLDQTVGIVPVVPLDTKVCEYYATLRAELQRRGTPIGSNDYWIAAHCLSLGLILVTNNVSEFIRVPNLAIQNWTE